MKVEILYEDSAVLVCVKPYGMPVQADQTRDLDLLDHLKTVISEREELEGEPYLAMVHRLDRPVGGIMVFAKTPQAAARLSDQVQDGTMVKYYQAVVNGLMPEEAGVLRDYLIKDGKTNLSRVVMEGTKGAKRAELEYEVLDEMETDQGVLSYVLIRLVTGRHHQIRAQLKHCGCGIYGDTKYSSVGKNGKKNGGQIALYATRLEFIHPETGEKLVFKTEPEGSAFDILDLEEE